MSEEVEDIRADVSLARDELTAMRQVSRIHGQAICELHAVTKAQASVIEVLIARILMLELGR